MTTLVRFAPSPTGYLHIGNIRTCLINYLFTRHHGGAFMLRLDDTDAERSREEYADQIKVDLAWMGMTWEKFDRQTDRLHRYQDAFEKLKNMGRLYPCFETAEELEIKRKIQLSRGLPPVYDRAALKLTEAEKKTLESERGAPHWRFRMASQPIVWNDLCRGTLTFHGDNFGDPVLYRADGKPIYIVASIVDDIDHGITHVIRGEDHITNTAIMVQIAEALNATGPQFAHLSLMGDASGEGFSKRTGSMSIKSLREGGIEPMAIASLLAKLGTSDPVELRDTMEQLIAEFDLAKFSQATPKFDVADLKRMNARLIHRLPFARVREKLTAFEAGDITEPMWNVIRENIEDLAHVRDWLDVIRGPVHPVIGDAAFMEQAAALLPQEPWDNTTWNAWVDSIKKASGRKGKDLFMPLRQAITGKEHGPELAHLLPLIGYRTTLNRLNGVAA